MSKIRAATEAVYAAFAKVAKPRAIEGCPCCIEGKEVDRLLAVPLHAIQPGEISSYAASALLTVGSVADYLYFLPRILEISATDDSWFPDIEITGRAIRGCDPASGPARQLEALKQLLRAVIDDAIESAAYDKLDDWMCAVGRMELDVTAYLEQIATVPAAVLAYFEDNASCLPHGKLCNSFWELPNPAHDEIVRWFYSEPIRQIPFDAYGYVLKTQA